MLFHFSINILAVFIFFFIESDCILHGYVKKLGGPWSSSWQMRYAKLYPNRLELHPDSAKPELIFMDQIEEVSPDLVQVKNENCIVVRLRDGKIVITNPVSKFRIQFNFLIWIFLFVNKTCLLLKFPRHVSVCLKILVCRFICTHLWICLVSIAILYVFRCSFWVSTL